MDAKDFQQIFPLGEKNEAFARFFVGQSYLKMLTTERVGIANVTFEPGCRNNWHIHHKGGQILLCAAGSDEDYGKDATAMIPVDEGPYYGITASFGPGSTTPMMVTMSGMLTDDDLRVLHAAGEPIKGLYVAGNCLGGRYGTGYSTPCAGNSIGFAGTHGRIAGQNAARG